MLAYFDGAIYDAIWLLQLPVLGIYWLVGIVLVVWLAVRARRAGGGRAWWDVAIATGAGVALLVVYAPLASAGDAARFERRFNRLEPTYRRIAEDLERNATMDADTTAGSVRFRVDTGPPVRVAFPQPGGIIDNWEGVVYDPSGVVATARGWSMQRGSQEFTAPPEVRGLFGGDLVICRPIRRSFYRCWFT